jgi:hypothetical protein
MHEFSAQNRELSMAASRLYADRPGWRGLLKIRKKT